MANHDPAAIPKCLSCKFSKMQDTLRCFGPNTTGMFKEPCYKVVIGCQKYEPKDLIELSRYIVYQAENNLDK